MARKIEQEYVIKDKGSKTSRQIIKKLQADLKALQKEVDKTNKKYDDIVKSQKKMGKASGGMFKDMKEGWGKVTKASLVAAAAIATVMATIKAGEAGAKLQDLEKAFDNYATSLGANSREIIEDLKAVSNQTISTADLMRSAGNAMLLGIPAEALDDLMKIARASMQITGQTATEAFSDITLAVGRGSKMILDNLGIILDVEKANKDYAKTLGKTSDELSDVEKKQAFLNATLAAGDVIIQNVDNVVQKADIYAQLGTQISEITDEFKKSTSEGLEPWLVVLNDIIKAARDWGKLQNEKIGMLDPSSLDTMEEVTDQLEKINKRMEQFSPSRLISPEWGIAAKQAEKLKERLDELWDAGMPSLMRKEPKMPQPAKPVKPGGGGDDSKIISDKESLLKTLKSLDERAVNERLALMEGVRAAEEEAIKVHYANLEYLAHDNAELEAQIDMAKYQELTNLYLKWEAEDLEARKEAGEKRLEIEKEVSDKMKEDIKEINTMLTSNMTDGFMAMVNGSMSAKEAFKDMARSILQNIAEMIIQTTIFNALQGATGGSGVYGAIASALVGSAKGNAFNQGSVMPFAKGGVVGSKTMFPMGMMGEAGPEAIMPLRRGPGGRLGIEASGNGGNTITTNITFTGDVGTREDQDRISRQISEQVAEQVRIGIANEQRVGGQLNNSGMNRRVF